MRNSNDQKTDAEKKMVKAILWICVIPFVVIFLIGFLFGFTGQEPPDLEKTVAEAIER